MSMKGHSRRISEAATSQSPRSSDGFQFDLESLEEDNRTLEAFIERELSKPSTPIQNILLIGVPGSGKSSCINTIFRVLTGQDVPVTDVGFGGRKQSKTLNVKWFKNCGICEEDLDGSPAHKQLRNLIHKLPNIVDCAGSQNINNEEIREILELLLGGYLPPGTNVCGLERLQQSRYVGCLRNTFTTPNLDWKISKIVFIHSARETVPTELVKCVYDVTRLTDRRSFRNRFSSDIFTVITRFDEVSEINDFLGGPESDHQLSKSAFLKVEQDLSEQLCFKGNMGQNRIRFINYSDKVTRDHPLLKNITLMFLKRMILRRRDYEPPVKEGLTIHGELRLLVESYVYWLKVQAYEKWVELIALAVAGLMGFCIFLLIFKYV